MLLLAGCSEQPLLEDRTSVKFSAAISDQTRTTMGGSAGTTAQFTAGDNIGVFETLTGRSNVPYAYGSSSWTASNPIYWYNGTSSHQFYAYYPYTASNSGLRVGMPVLSTQQIATSPGPAWDMLVAGPLNQTRGANVPLTFTHAFAMIQLNISLGILVINPYVLNRITVRGGNAEEGGPFGIANITGTPSRVGYNLTTKSVWAASNDASSYTQTFYSDVTGTSLLSTAISFYFYVLPGTYNNPTPAVSLRISILGINNNTAYANFTSKTFVAGTKYVYNLSVGLLTASPQPQLTLVPDRIVPIGDLDLITE